MVRCVCNSVAIFTANSTTDSADSDRSIAHKIDFAIRIQFMYEHSGFICVYRHGLNRENSDFYHTTRMCKFTPCNKLSATEPIPIISNATFREIFQGSAEGIIIVNKGGEILMSNAVAEKMFGYS